jgi:hypothetical protein
MIKVYVFITGLVLYQFAPSPGGTSYAILVEGNYDIPGLGFSAQHEIKVLSGQATNEAKVNLPLEARLTVGCRVGGCKKKVEEPPQIHSLADLLALDWVQPTLYSDCLAFNGGKSCHARGVPALGRSGLLAFSGDWSYEALTDCGTGYPNLAKFDRMNYVRAWRSWELRYPFPREVANTVLFTATIDKMEDLKIVGNAQLQGLLDPGQFTEGDCAGLYTPPGSTVAKRCAVLLIRNGSTDMYKGGGDLHFAPLYMLLENHLQPSELWLPIVTDSKYIVCTEGGGGDHLSHCTGGRVPAQEYKR